MVCFVVINIHQNWSTIVAIKEKERWKSTRDDIIILCCHCSAFYRFCDQYMFWLKQIIIARVRLRTKCSCMYNMIKYLIFVSFSNLKLLRITSKVVRFLPRRSCSGRGATGSCTLACGRIGFSQEDNLVRTPPPQATQTPREERDHRPWRELKIGLFLYN